eukprot:TRINITY_DN7783_c0_g3_i1.p1 TRINITY_DN7783_c0_g3~~TRINITY_DN7783_c0_g3_i1.p1  ORF type:complete len:183 (-),score=29.99 TRINITY_DN7783_c0_g3_i1:90-638(-)
MFTNQNVTKYLKVDNNLGRDGIITVEGAIAEGSSARLSGPPQAKLQFKDVTFDLYDNPIPVLINSRSEMIPNYNIFSTESHLHCAVELPGSSSEDIENKTLAKQTQQGQNISIVVKGNKPEDLSSEVESNYEATIETGKFTLNSTVSDVPFRINKAKKLEKHAINGSLILSWEKEEENDAWT